MVLEFRARARVGTGKEGEREKVLALLSRSPSGLSGKSLAAFHVDEQVLLQLLSEGLIVCWEVPVQKDMQLRYFMAPAP